MKKGFKKFLIPLFLAITLVAGYFVVFDKDRALIARVDYYHVYPVKLPLFNRVQNKTTLSCQDCFKAGVDPRGIEPLVLLAKGSVLTFYTTGPGMPHPSFIITKNRRQSQQFL